MSNLSKFDAFLHKTQSKVLLALKCQGFNQIKLSNQILYDYKDNYYLLVF